MDCLQSGVKQPRKKGQIRAFFKAFKFFTVYIKKLNK